MRNKLIVLFGCFLPCVVFAQYPIDTNMISAASGLFNLCFSTSEKDSMLDGLTDSVLRYQKLHRQPRHPGMFKN